MNVLLTCAGRRNYLVEYFKQALGDKGEVFTADHCALASALQEADASFILPAVCDPDYTEQLLSICVRHNVRVVISLNDLELPILAAHKSMFEREGITVVVSDPRVVDTCYDKLEAISFARTHGIDVPATFPTLEGARRALDTGELRLPVVVKPRRGSASFALEVCDDDEELVYAYHLTRKLLSRSQPALVINRDMEKNILIQEQIRGQEYGLDVINDLNQRYVCTFVKKKLAMRAGETDKAVTLDHPELRELGEKIGKGLGHIGNLDCDVFIGDGRCCLIDMNPRFGGGYPFSHMAGANVPAALLAWAGGKTADLSWLTVTPGVTAVKCDRLLKIR